MKNTYTRELIQLCEQKTIQQIVKTNQYKQLVLDETCFLNILDGVTFTTRLYCIKNNIHTIPGCKKCGQPCSPKAENAKLGFNQYCSSTCSRSDKTIKKESLKFLQDYDWLYHQRITLQKSKHLIAEELEISTMPVTKWIKIHKIPEVKYNCSNPNALAKLTDRDWLYTQHKIHKKKCDDIGNELNISKSTVSVWLSKHNIQSNEVNSYDRNHVTVSNECQEIVNYIQSIYQGSIQLNNRTILNGLELDIYLPDINLAIEYNGVYSHLYRPEEDSFSSRKDSKYHLHKTVECEKQNIQLIHIFSDSWKNKKDIWKSHIKNKLKGFNIKVYARKCVIREIDVRTKNVFLEENHLQSKDKSLYKYGLYYNNDLVAVMTFGKSRYNRKYQWELMRFAIKQNHSIAGGFSKLLNHFRKNIEGSIISYADRTYSNGNVYLSNFFKLITINKPSYYYVMKNSEERLHRSNFIKSKISNKDDSRTEEEIMKDSGYSKIFDCGTLTFVLN